MNKTVVMEGLDVSKYQGAIDWRRVRAAGMRYAIIRQGWINNDGSITVDPFYAQNMGNAAAAGVHTGVYLYSYARSVDAMRKAAENCIRLLDGFACDMPVVLDFEHGKLYKDFSRAANVAMCKAFLDEVQALGYFATLYTYKAFAASYLNMSQLAAYDFWLAHYCQRTNYAGAYGMWQYTSTGKVPGISGSVDMNYAYKDYPSIIRKAGENKLGKPAEVPQPEAEAPAERPDVYYYPAYPDQSGSIVQALAAVGERDTSYAHREQIAAVNRIPDYTGTPAQNTKMVQMLRDGVLMRTGRPADADYVYPVYTGHSNSIVAALRTVGETDPSYSHRCMIAAANSIQGYHGTPAQNLDMVALLKLGKLRKAA